MTRLTWGDRPPIYDYGLDQGVLYLQNDAVPWNGLVDVDEQAVGEVDMDFYYDGRRRRIFVESGDFKARLSAYTYPDAFAEYNGYDERETYQRFSLSYRTQNGDDYELHLVYNVLIRDDSRKWVTQTDAPMPSTFAWDIHGSTVPIPGARPSSHLTMSSAPDPSVLSELEDILYGTLTTEPRLPTPEEVVEMYEDVTTLRITNNRDGTWSASGPDDMVRVLEDGRFEIDAPSALYLRPDLFVVNSH